MALPKKHRLKHRQDFSQVYRKGIRRTSRHLTLRALSGVTPTDQVQQVDLAVPTEASMPTQIGVSVSTKVSKRAVVRNRIRRWLWAAFQQFLPKLNPGWQLVVVVHPHAVECDYQQFLQELNQLLVDAEVINGNS